MMISVMAVGMTTAVEAAAAAVRRRRCSGSGGTSAASQQLSTFGRVLGASHPGTKYPAQESLTSIEMSILIDFELFQLIQLNMFFFCVWIEPE
mgnify:CR=1 FL=1